MSSTNRGGQRVANDYYPTPAWCVHRLLEAVDLPTDGVWVEPAAGEGAIIEAVRTAGISPRRWIAWEIQPQFEPALLTMADGVYAHDYLQGPYDGRFQVAITNPPFGLTRQFIDACLADARHVLFLLRLNYMGSASRVALMQATRPDVYVLPNRPSFTGNGKTDSIEYAWFHWLNRRGPEGGILRVLNATPIEERR